ncbi:IclR family transcriptional regulator [Rhodopseudomonas sp. P2A-2r]|uniref:IclR family transcriptional regulator n=1 Tax=unclassified Rhodopseudomonas TaxID=2638247 RepID=UPI0022340FD0|nr:IclR family transcriptional regulator [Rhodopseudomonas sp. P2A-2r]UZE47623.1 IclR family transcriptional regulator [Rhodopseudomonas sp. P2A-2r]
MSDVLRESPAALTANAAPPERPAPQGAQTLMRALDVLEAIAAGTVDLAALSAKLGTTRSTTHRLASALVDRRYLNFSPRGGYSLGPKLLELGFRAQRDMPLRQVAHGHLVELAALTQDTVQLGILDENVVLYIDKVPGQRRFEIRSTIGDRHAVWSTGLGKALVLDSNEADWKAFYDRAAGARRSAEDWQQSLARMRTYAQRGAAFDLEESAPELRCVAAPIRDASGAIVAAISVSSIAQYMQPERMDELSHDVRATAASVSRALGWR